MEKEPIFANPIINFDNLPILHDNLYLFYQKIAATNEERSFSILSALVIENILDELLLIIMPKYKKDKWSNATGRKVEVLESLNLVSVRHIELTRLIFKVRNKFAHHLDIDSFEGLSDDLKKEIADYYSSTYYFPPQKDTFETYKDLVNWELMSLMQQESSLRLLRRKIESPEFIDTLRKESDWQEKHGSFEPMPEE